MKLREEIDRTWRAVADSQAEVNPAGPVNTMRKQLLAAHDWQYEGDSQELFRAAIGWMSQLAENWEGTPDELVYHSAIDAVVKLAERR